MILNDINYLHRFFDRSDNFLLVALDPDNQCYYVNTEKYVPTKHIQWNCNGGIFYLKDEKSDGYKLVLASAFSKANCNGIEYPINGCVIEFRPTK